MEMNLAASVAALAYLFASGEDFDFAALPHYGPSREWVEKVANGLGKGKATEQEIESLALMFEAPHGERHFPSAAIVACDPEWQADCDAVAMEVHARKATIPELFCFQLFKSWQADRATVAAAVAKSARAKPQLISGTVVEGPDSKPVAGARIVGIFPAQSVSDEQGRFSLATRTNQFGFAFAFIRAPGREFAVRIPADAEPPSAYTASIVRLQPGATLSGIALDESGQPAENASVRLCVSPPDAPLSTRVFQTATDGAGRFRFEEMPPAGLIRSFEIKSTGAAYLAKSNVKYDGPDKTAAARVFHLNRTASVRGKVTGADARPVFAAYVELKDANGYVHSRTYTNRRGEFLHPAVPPGSYRAIAEKVGRAMGFVPIEVADKPIEGVNVPMPRGEYI
ncbi:MAG TPA: carboxypeptidase-like regulatory domain-containing protein, partial [Planctomycetia bacterium]|nr:carboxypeptidase-like regulatory domain-containing protein [Planctomycetia bacterium]